NVYPVPDGDTGTNMYLTLSEVAKAAERARTAAAGEVSAAMARAALYECKGNSGLILYQFFKGIAAALEGKADFGISELALAFEHARTLAYRAVPNPVEGTLLTVISSVARAARECAEAGLPVQETLDAICAAARETVALTPTMLPTLRDAGVVDAGGQGLSVILEGVRAHWSGTALEGLRVDAPEPIGVAEGAGRVSVAFLESVEHEMYGYCTNLVIQGELLNPDEIREGVSPLGRSLVVVGDESLVKVHIHAEDPGRVLSYGVSLGTISQVNIQNMDEQHREFSEARQREQETLPIAIVAVAWGEGIERVFEHDGGATIIRAGDTMNPSVRDILDAAERAPSQNVIVLPNNRNIVATAKQAAEVSEKTVRVVPTTSIPQGIAAMLAFDQDSDLDANIAAMEQAMCAVRTGEICAAVRDSMAEGVQVREGQIIGLLDRKLLVAGDDANGVLVSLLQRAGVTDGNLITLYWGAPLREEDAEAAKQMLEEAFEDAEVDIVAGGQPLYHYIVSIE
ncbi:MAG TPA: DAK2 domain-containing protein, partial [Candidatus Krumholzibacteria bacterium]